VRSTRSPPAFYETLNKRVSTSRAVASQRQQRPYRGRRSLPCFEHHGLCWRDRLGGPALADSAGAIDLRPNLALSSRTLLSVSNWSINLPLSNATASDIDRLPKSLGPPPRDVYQIAGRSRRRWNFRNPHCSAAKHITDSHGPGHINPHSRSRRIQALTLIPSVTISIPGWDADGYARDQSKGLNPSRSRMRVNMARSVAVRDMFGSRTMWIPKIPPSPQRRAIW
jgi:hypothetical protein